MPSRDVAQVEAETRDYYRARADEFEDWYRRRGTYQHGPEADAAWNRELGEMDAFIEPLRDRTVLEVAAGTGWWTRRLAPRNRVIATDYAPDDDRLRATPCRSLGRGRALPGRRLSPAGR